MRLEKQASTHSTSASACASSLNGQASHLGEMLLPVGRVEAVGAYFLARGRGVDEPAAAQINADVGVLLAFLVEEDQVAAAQGGEAHGAGSAALLLGVVRDGDAGLPVAELHEAAAIESGG